MKSFTCPHNRNTTILHQCPIEECPYHVTRVGKLYNVECKTGCVFYDTHLMSDETPARTQISALSRDSTRMVAHSAIRGLYTDMLRNSKTLYALTHDVVHGVHCSRCGYPRKPRCTSSHVCAERDEWVTQVLTSVLKIQQININFKAIIWRQLLDKALYLDAALIKTGFELCNGADVRAPD